MFLSTHYKIVDYTTEGDGLIICISSLRGLDRFGPNRQRVVSDVRFVPLLRLQRPGNATLLRQLGRLQPWVSGERSENCFSSCCHKQKPAAIFDMTPRERALWLAQWLLTLSELEHHSVFYFEDLVELTDGPPVAREPPVDNQCVCVSAAPDPPSGLLQGVMVTLVMSLVLLALLVLVLWLRGTGQDGRRKVEEEESSNEIRYTPPLMKRSFVWRLSGTGEKRTSRIGWIHWIPLVLFVQLNGSSPHLCKNVELNVRVVTSELVLNFNTFIMTFSLLRRVFQNKSSKLKYDQVETTSRPFHSDKWFLINYFKVKTTWRRVSGNDQDQENDFKWTKFSPDRSRDLSRGRKSLLQKEEPHTHTKRFNHVIWTVSFWEKMFRLSSEGLHPSEACHQELSYK